MVINPAENSIIANPILNGYVRHLNRFNDAPKVMNFAPDGMILSKKMFRVENESVI